jgi:quinol monooxygenase YgiN
MQVPAVVFAVRLIAGEDVRRELTALIAPTRTQPGCLRCELLLDATNPSAVELVEEWQSRADLDRHLRSDDCRRLLAAVDLAAAPPYFRIDTVAGREGIEAIAAARGPSVGPDEAPQAADRPLRESARDVSQGLRIPVSQVSAGPRTQSGEPTRTPERSSTWHSD